MDEIRRQVLTARRRMVLQQFVSVLPWSLFITLLVAVVALAVPKIWVIDVDARLWTTGWLNGSLAAGILLAIVWTWFTRHDLMDAAVEMDRRFGLKERVSSALSLAPEEVDSEPGLALIHDASRRVELISVREQFGVRANWRTLLPLLPALLVFLLVFVGNAQPQQVKAATSTADTRNVKKAARELREQLDKQHQRAQEKGLKEAEELINKVREGVDDLAGKQNVDRRQAMLKINDLAKQVEKRRRALGNGDEMKKQFERLKNIERGPADKVANALKEGDFQKALEQLKELQEKLANGDMTDQEKEQLKQQLRQMQQKMQEMVDAHEAAKRELESRIQDKMNKGDLAGANELQRKLDQLQQQDPQMARMQRMADRLSECQNCMQDGNMQSASDQLAQLAEELEELQSEMDELQSLDEMMDEIASAKEAMRDGMGGMDGFNQGGMSDQYSDMPGDGLGPGRGYGYRPEQETETGEYQAQQRGDVQGGEAVRTGDAVGPNKAGLSQEEIKEQIQSSLSKKPEPLTDQRLPKSQLEHVNEYFQRLRDGE